VRPKVRASLYFFAVVSALFLVYTIFMRFEWDPAKAKSNAKKHRVTFEDSVVAFDDPFALIEHDTGHSTPEEDREILIGEAWPGVLVVVYTIREQGEVYRIISARRATRREKRIYEEAKRVSL
jgi:uncharacterized DUF497 family protein